MVLLGPTVIKTRIRWNRLANIFLRVHPLTRPAVRSIGTLSPPSLTRTNGTLPTRSMRLLCCEPNTPPPVGQIGRRVTRQASPLFVTLPWLQTQRSILPLKRVILLPPLCATDMACLPMNEPSVSGACRALTRLTTRATLLLASGHPLSSLTLPPPWHSTLP